MAPWLYPIHPHLLSLELPLLHDHLPHYSEYPLQAGLRACRDLHEVVQPHKTQLLITLILLLYQCLPILALITTAILLLTTPGDPDVKHESTIPILNACDYPRGLVLNETAPFIKHYPIARLQHGPNRTQWLGNLSNLHGHVNKISLIGVPPDIPFPLIGQCWYRWQPGTLAHA